MNDLRQPPALKPVKSETTASGVPAVGIPPLLAGSVWFSVDVVLPEPGDIIACCAEHKDGGPMYWAGVVTKVSHGFADMEVRGGDVQRFTLTYDTLWMRLPPPNTEVRGGA